MWFFKIQTPLALDALFDATQVDLVSSDRRPEEVRFLLENDDEFLIAYGDEIEVVVIEEEFR